MLLFLSGITLAVAMVQSRDNRRGENQEEENTKLFKEIDEQGQV